MTKNPGIQRDWVSKSLAGLVCGGLLSIAMTGLIDLWCASVPLSIRGQIDMWLLPPIWLAVMSGVYFFRSGRQAWVNLGLAALIGGLAYVALRVF